MAQLADPMDSLREIAEKLTGKQAVSSIADLDEQIAQLRAKLLKLYKLKSGHADLEREPEEVTDDWLQYVENRYRLDGDNNDLKIDNNVLRILFTTPMAFRIKERDVPFYVTAMPYKYSVLLDLITYTTAVRTENTIHEAKPEPKERRGIVATAPRQVTTWGHPHAAEHVKDTHLLEHLCYGDNYFPGDAHKGMRLNEIVTYLDKALAWVREISADDNYANDIVYKTRCKSLRFVFPDINADLADVRKALISMEGQSHKHPSNICKYAHYFACYAYHKISQSTVFYPGLDSKRKSVILNAIGTDIAFGLGEYLPEERIQVTNPWYVETLFNCRKELEEVFYI